jgi:hypothetical protein
VSCPSPYKISVITAVYGPPTSTMCGPCSACGSCTYSSVLSYFNGFNGVTSGSLQVSNGAFGDIDPFFGYGKLSILTYKCI